MLGALFGSALIALCVRVVVDQNLKKTSDQAKRFAVYVLLALTTVSLVWVSARGWFLASLVGVSVACMAAVRQPNWRRLGLWSSVLAIVALSLKVLPIIDPQFGGAYSLAMDASSHPEYLLGEAGSGLKSGRPVLGEASCVPFKEGTNSIAMRWVLYQEAIAMFLQKPLFGVGAAKFGEQSCTGVMGFPHSTILQGLAELGLLGGGILIALTVLAALTLLHITLSAREERNWPVNGFVLALFGAYLFASQIHGHYFMAVGMWLLFGMAAGLRANIIYESK